MRDLLIFTVGAVGAVLGYLMISAVWALVCHRGQAGAAQGSPYRDAGVTAEPKPPRLTLLAFLKHLHDTDRCDAYFNTLLAMSLVSTLGMIPFWIFLYNVLALFMGHD